MTEFLQKKYVETEHGKIFYFTHFCSSDRPTVLLLHGLSSNHTTWEEMMKKFAEMNINTIAPDLRGHGYSDKTKVRRLYKISEAKNDIEAILKQENISAAHFIGYSWGGYIAMDMAAACPKYFKSLILVSTNYEKIYSKTPLSILVSLLSNLLILLGYLVVWQKRKNYHYFQHGESSGYWQSTFTGLSTMPLSINFWMLSEAMTVDFSNKTHSITCPTYLMFGQKDPYISQREIKELGQKIINSETIILNNLDHFLAGHHQDILSGYIADFIKTNENSHL